MVRGWFAAVATAVVLVTAGLVTVGAAEAAGNVTVDGNRFLRDGKPWVAEGVTLVGLVAPAAQLKRKEVYAEAQAGFGAGTLDEVRRFGADLVRFQVSQGPLDPKSKHHDPGYRTEVLDGIALTRAAGYSVLVSMRARGPAEPGGADELPSASTRRAWGVIAAAVGADRGVLFEVFNEPPGNPRTPAEWRPWQKSMQAAIDALRKAGAQNVLLIPGMQYSRTLDGILPLNDPLDQLGYAVHPYLGQHNQTRAQWDKKFGDQARTHAVMATEWNAQSGGSYCRPEMEAQAEALLAYLHEKRIGLVAWALDMPNLRNPDGSYTRLDDLVCGREGDRDGAGQMIHEYFVAN